MKADGSRFLPRAGFETFDEIAPIQQYQVIQHALDDIEFKLVSAEPLGPAQEDALAATLRKALVRGRIRVAQSRERLPDSRRRQVRGLHLQARRRRLRRTSRPAGPDRCSRRTRRGQAMPLLEVLGLKDPGRGKGGDDEAPVEGEEERGRARRCRRRSSASRPSPSASTPSSTRPSSRSTPSRSRRSRRPWRPSCWRCRSRGARPTCWRRWRRPSGWSSSIRRQATSGSRSRER